MIGTLQPKRRAGQHAGEPCSCAAVKCVTVTPACHQARFAFQRFCEQGPASALTRSNLVIVTAEFSSQGRKDLFSINAGVAKFAVAVAALIVQPDNLAHPT